MTLADDIKRILRDGQRKADAAAAAIEIAAPDYDFDDGDEDEEEEEEEYSDEEEEEAGTGTEVTGGAYGDGGYADLTGFLIQEPDEEEEAAPVDEAAGKEVAWRVVFLRPRSFETVSALGEVEAIEQARQQLIASVGEAEALEYVFDLIEEA